MAHSLKFTKYRSAIVIPVITLSLICILLALRVGFIPAASTGDIWCSEPAYWLLKTGVLSAPMHPDAVGSAIRDFYPPTPALFQAVSFRVLGLSQLSVAIAPTLTLYTIILINFFVFYRAGVSYKLCGLLSIAFLAAPDWLRYAVQARFEIYQTLFIMLFFVSIQQGLKIGNAALQFASGLFLAAAGYSYYQFFPLTLFVLSCVAIFNIRRGQTLSTIAATPLGFLVISAAFAIWIGGDFYWFLHQNIEFGRGYDLISRIGIPHLLVGPVQLQALPLFAFGSIYLIHVAQRGIFESVDRFLSVLFFALGAASAFLGLVFHGQILLSAIAISLALTATLRFCSSRERILITCGLTGLSIVSVLLLITVAAKAITSANRNYETFARQLRNESNLAGIVLIDDPAWLALREITSRDQLVHIAGYANDASRSNKAVVLSAPEMAPLVSMLAVLPSNLYFEKRFPLIAAFLERDDVEGPITIGVPGPYEVLLYRIRRAGTPVNPSR